MSTFEMTAQVRSNVAVRRTFFWNTLWVFWRAIARTTRAERNSAPVALRYVTVETLLSRRLPPDRIRTPFSERCLLKGSDAVIRHIRETHPGHLGQLTPRDRGLRFLPVTSEPRLQLRGIVHFIVTSAESISCVPRTSSGRPSQFLRISAFRASKSRRRSRR